MVRARCTESPSRESTGARKGRPATTNRLSSRAETGRKAEALAAEYLTGQGLRVVATNYRCAIGEIDLICLDGSSYVFVEVRSRTGTRHGLPQESVTRRKQLRLIRLAQWYLREVRDPQASARFDVVAVVWRGGRAELRWFVNAFDAGA